MGNIEKRFCDWNGEPLNGTSNKLRLMDGSAAVVDMDLCGGCYTMWLDYLKSRRDMIAEAWRVDPKAIEPVVVSGKP